MKRFLLACVCFLGMCTGAFAKVPHLQGRVNDYANVLTPEQEHTLEARLTAFQTVPGHPQVVVLTTSTLDDKTIEEYSIAIARAWGIGQKGGDNGILITIYPAHGDKFQGRIEVGRGLEGTVTDAESLAVYERMRPYWKQEGHENYFSAFMSAANDLERLMRHNASSDPLFARAIHAQEVAAQEHTKEVKALLWMGGMVVLGALFCFASWWFGMGIGAVGGIIGSIILAWGFWWLILLIVIGAIAAIIVRVIIEISFDGEFSSGGSSSGGGFSGGGGGFGGGGFSGGR